MELRYATKKPSHIHSYEVIEIEMGTLDHAHTCHSQFAPTF